MKLLIVAGKDMILVVCNRLTKITHFVTTIKEILVEGLVRLFRNNIWKLYGLHKSVVSDREPQFATKMMRELNKILRIETSITILS